MACTMREALERYAVYAHARGFTEKTIAHTRLCVALFDDFLGTNKDVGEVAAAESSTKGLQPSTVVVAVPPAALSVNRGPMRATCR